MLGSLIAAVAAVFGLVTGPLDDSKWSADGNPHMVISNVRLINCSEGQGSGWIIGKGVLVTAAHVANGTNCTDGATNMPLRKAKEDPVHDVALMTGNLPDYGHYIKYSCDGFKPGHKYQVYGWSSVGMPAPILRRHDVVATDKKTDPNDKYRDGSPIPVMRAFEGYTVPGMSGGMYTEADVAYGLVVSGFNKRTYYGEFYYPEVYAADLKETFLCR